jgi:hypothetical protein
LCFADVLCRKASIHSQEQHTQLKKIWLNTYDISLELGVIINHGRILVHISICLSSTYHKHVILQTSFYFRNLPGCGHWWWCYWSYLQVHSLDLVLFIYWTSLYQLLISYFSTCSVATWMLLSTEEDSTMALPLSSSFRSIISGLFCLKLFLVPLLVNVILKTLVMLIIVVDLSWCWYLASCFYLLVNLNCIL